MGYSTTYATPEILEATWEAVSPGATGGAIEIRPYPTAAPRAGGGFAMPAPPPDPFDGFDDYGGKRYLDASGNPQWMPTPDEIARDRRAGLPIAGIDYDRLDGMDGSYAGRPPRPVAPSPARSVGRAARGTVGDAIGGVGGAVGLGVGGILDGGIAGYAEYQSGGGVASAVAVGVGAGVGSAVGTVVGGIAGSALGPVGTVVGGMIGGAIGSALGGAIGDALIPDANLNGVSAEGTDPPFSGGQGVGVSYQVLMSISYEQANGYLDWRGNWIIIDWVPAVAQSVRTITGPIFGTQAIYLSAYQKIIWHVVFGVNNLADFALPLDGNIPNERRNWGQPELTIWRTDGQPDTHGDPPPTPVPYNPAARDRPATGTPDFRLPGVDLPRPRPRPIFGNPRLRDPNPVGEPSPEPNPDPTDDPYPYPYPWPRPTPTPGPTPDPAPYPDPTDDPNPNPNPDDDDDDQENCDPCAKLDQVLELLQPAIAGQIDLSPCPVEGEEALENVIAVADGAAGIAGLSAKLDLALAGVEDLWELLRCQDEDQRAFPIPDSWELKKELNCPQLVVTVKKPADKSTYRRSFAIPHPKAQVCTEEGAKRVFTSRRTFTKGSHLTQLVLKDNSKIRLYVADRATGQSLMDWIVGQCLDSSYQDTPPGIYRHGENSGREVAGETVEFYTVTYYSKGRESNLPDWMFTIPE